SLDADDGVELAGDVAIVLLAEVDARMALPRPFELLFGEANRGYLAAARGEIGGERAPAAANLKQGLGRAQPFRQAIPFAALRRLQAVPGPATSARIAHRPNEPRAAEVLPAIVVAAD